jgi:GTP-binding protein LepA
MQSRIRNFAIIAHIDHGKSTLADRLLEMTGTVAHRDMRAQILDSNPIERERGITIKLAPVRMHYKDYILNLIDTPGHVDFGYEVSRSLAACEGALLVVDATQGVQAQTLANLHQARLQTPFGVASGGQARQHKLTIIPIINKIDMPTARIEETGRELEALGFPPISPITPSSPILISAKTGENVEKVLETIVERIPPPKGVATGTPLRGLVFSSQYDTHKGVVVFVRIVDGDIPFLSSTRLRFMASGASVTPIEVGYFIPQLHAIGTGDKLSAGEVGYIATGLKDVRFAKVGDTITMSPVSCPVSPLPGYKEPKPMVFLRLFPINSEEFTYARETMEKLRLSDSAFTFRPISSLALGNGFHCGFLGLLHAEIVQERLSREFDLNMIATAPSVEYHLKKTSGEEISIQSAAEFPDPTVIAEVREPVMTVTIYTPKRYIGPVMQLSEEKRGQFIDLSYKSDQSYLSYRMPLSDMIIDFFDRLKSITEGYASLDYEFFDYQPVDVVKIDILVNKEKVDALSFLVVRDQAHARSIEITDRLAAVIPRQQFEVPIQAAIGGKVVARSDVKAFRKDVIQKLYGGDRTRKDKLLKKQKKGKARMRMIGRVEIPQSAFFEVLKRD